eukprot:444943-Hanusia_phi.AAC.3
MSEEELRAEEENAEESSLEFEEGCAPAALDRSFRLTAHVLWDCTTLEADTVVLNEQTSR